MTKTKYISQSISLPRVHPLTVVNHLLSIWYFERETFDLKEGIHAGSRTDRHTISFSLYNSYHKAWKKRKITSANIWQKMQPWYLHHSHRSWDLLPFQLLLAHLPPPNICPPSIHPPTHPQPFPPKWKIKIYMAEEMLWMPHVGLPAEKDRVL